MRVNPSEKRSAYQDTAFKLFDGKLWSLERHGAKSKKACGVLFDYSRDVII